MLYFPGEEMLFICSVTVGGSSFFFSFWLLVPSLSWNTLRSMTAFVSINDGFYSESFGLISLDQELFHMSFSAG